MRQERRRKNRQGSALVIAGVVLCGPIPAVAEEVAPFRVTGVDGYAQLSYLSDSQSQGSGTTSSNSVGMMQEELFLNMHSYFYHPNFLKMDVGGGPLLVQNRFEAGGVSNSDQESLYNLVGRLSLLEQKPFPLAVYYEHLNPVLVTSLTQSFVQTNTKTGATFSLREPLSPVLVTADVFSLQSEGQSTNWVVDDNIKQASLRASSALGQDGYNQVLYQVNRQDSMSGNPAAVIVPVAIENRIASMDTRVLFGADRTSAFSNHLSASRLSYTSTSLNIDREDFRFSPDLRVQHTDTWSSFYTYSLYKSSELLLDATNQSARVGLTYRETDRWLASADVHGDSNRITGLTLISSGAGMQASYSQRWESALLRLSAGAIYDQKDREADSALINMIGERITLVDGIPVTLAQEFIDTTTIRVFNLTRTQEYCPDVLPLPVGCTAADYRIIVIGTRTQIQRLATGNILDGQEVLVDYSYQTGGTASYRTLDQNYQVTFTLFRYYTAYARHRKIDYELQSGTPTLLFNPIRNTLYGFRVDYPLPQGFMVGGEAVSESQDEVYAPFNRRAYDAYLQMTSMFNVYARLSARRLFVDYTYSPEDVDLTGWGVQLRTRAFDYTTLTAEANYESDVGGTLHRVVWRDTLGLEWRIRQLSVRAEGQHIREEQGAFERDRTVLRVIARREFR